jgi:hypothetical protein
VARLIVEYQMRGIAIGQNCDLNMNAGITCSS